MNGKATAPVSDVLFESNAHTRHGKDEKNVCQCITPVCEKCVKNVCRMCVNNVCQYASLWCVVEQQQQQQRVKKHSRAQEHDASICA
jgi:hypothetical protein